MTAAPAHWQQENLSDTDSSAALRLLLRAPLLLATALVQLSAIPIVVAEKCVAVLTVGIDAAHEEAASNIL